MSDPTPKKEEAVLVLPYRTLEMKVNELPWLEAEPVNDIKTEVCNYLYLRMPSIDPEISEFVRFICFASHRNTMVTLGKYTYVVHPGGKCIMRAAAKDTLKVDKAEEETDAALATGKPFLAVV